MKTTIKQIYNIGSLSVVMNFIKNVQVPDVLVLHTIFGLPSSDEINTFQSTFNRISNLLFYFNFNIFRKDLDFLPSLFRNKSNF